MKKCYIFLTVCLLANITLKADAGIIPIMTLNPVYMSGTGLVIDQKIAGDEITLTFKPTSQNIASFGLDLAFNPEDYRIISGGLEGQDSLVTMWGSRALNNDGAVVITLEKKGDVWKELRPHGLEIFTGNTDNRERKIFQPAEPFTPVPTPKVAALYGNYPNPFNPETQIRFQIPEATQVTLEIYNIVGQKIKTLVDGKMVPGEYTTKWSGTDDFGRKVGSGVYFYRMDAGNFHQVHRMILLK